MRWWTGYSRYQLQYSPNRVSGLKTVQEILNRKASWDALFTPSNFFAKYKYCSSVFSLVCVSSVCPSLEITATCNPLTIKLFCDGGVLPRFPLCRMCSFNFMQLYHMHLMSQTSWKFRIYFCARHSWVYLALFWLMLLLCGDRRSVLYWRCSQSICMELTEEWLWF